MPRDYDLSAMAKSGLERGRGKGRFSGMPEGTHGAAGRYGPHFKSYMSPKPGSGVIRGNPVGIKGSTRSGGKKAAIMSRMGK